MKRADLIRKIRARAKAIDKHLEFERQGGNHEVWTCGNTRVIIPRHQEINRFTAEGIFKDLEEELGEDWWRR